MNSFKRKTFTLKQNYLNTLSASSDAAAKFVNGMDSMTDILNSNISINCYNVPDETVDNADAKNSKYHSGKKTFQLIMHNLKRIGNKKNFLKILSF